VDCNTHLHGRMLGISVYCYLYRKLAKMLCLSYYLLFSAKLENKSVDTWKQCLGCVLGNVSHTMYTHVDKRDNDKVKKIKTEI
jgi:hypothetical protein